MRRSLNALAGHRILRSGRSTLLPVFASKRAEQVTTQDVDRLRDTLLKRLAPQTVKHVMELLRRLLNYAVKRELIEPVRILFDMPQFDNKVTETMTAEQMRCFLEALDREPDKVAIAGVKLALLTGARHGQSVPSDGKMWTLCGGSFTCGQIPRSQGRVPVYR